MHWIAHLTGVITFGEERRRASGNEYEMRSSIFFPDRAWRLDGSAGAIPAGPSFLLSRQLLIFNIPSIFTPSFYFFLD
jgi:hypothetical protein